MKIYFQLKLQETDLKTELTRASGEYQRLTKNIGLMGNNLILGDYTKTAEEISMTQKSLEDAAKRPVVPPLAMENRTSSEDDE